MVTSGKVPIPSPTVHNFEDAKIQGEKRRSRVKLGGGVDVNNKEQPSKEESSVTTRRHGDLWIGSRRP